MNLLTAAQRRRLLANAAHPDADHRPVVKWFDPCGAATWLATELDPEDPDIARCLADLGMGHPELGTVRLSEIAAVRGALGLGVERDLYFRASYPISVYTAAAQAAGRIVESGPELDAAARRREDAS